MKKIKVLHITHATEGGVAEYIKLFFSHVNKDKYEICLICPKYGPLKSEIENMGINVYTIEMSRDIDIKNDLRSFLNIKKAINEIKPDIVHLHSSKAGVLGKLASYLNKVPCIYNAHGWSFSMNVSRKKKKVYALIEKYTSIFCNKIVNISDYEHYLANKYRIAKNEKMITIYNGISMDKYSNLIADLELKSSLDIPQEGFVIGSVARITEAKDPKKFIDIANEVCKLDDNVYFIWVGDGELRNEIEKLILKYNLNSRVKITGWTNQVEKYISIFDIGILTSKWEGFGLSIIEYMASNKPVIASAVGGITSIIQNRYNGILINDRSTKGFTSAIEELKTKKELREKLINNAKETVKYKFNIKDLVEEHSQLYMKIISESKE